jgi:hypothetical protein
VSAQSVSLSLFLLLLQFHGNEAEDASQIGRDDLQFVRRSWVACLDLHWRHLLHCEPRINIACECPALNCGRFNYLDAQCQSMQNVLLLYNFLRKRLKATNID